MQLAPPQSSSRAGGQPRLPLDVELLLPGQGDASHYRGRLLARPSGVRRLDALGRGGGAASPRKAAIGVLWSRGELGPSRPPHLRRAWPTGLCPPLEPFAYLQRRDAGPAAGGALVLPGGGAILVAAAVAAAAPASRISRLALRVASATARPPPAATRVGRRSSRLLLLRKAGEEASERTAAPSSSLRADVLGGRTERLASTKGAFPARQPLEPGPGPCVRARHLGTTGAHEAAAAAAAALSLPAEAYGNDPTVEMIWAMKAHQHAEVYFNLISSVDPKFLKLTKADDQIYTEFRKGFNHLKIDVLDSEDLKSEPAKEKWRPFCLQFDGVVEDFNYGTLLRLDCSKGYTEENTVFGSNSSPLK